MKKNEKFFEKFPAEIRDAISAIDSYKDENINMILLLSSEGQGCLTVHANKTAYFVLLHTLLEELSELLKMPLPILLSVMLGISKENIISTVNINNPDLDLIHKIFEMSKSANEKEN